MEHDAVFDLIVRGGTVVDGTGAPSRAADVGVADGRIVAVADLEPVMDFRPGA
jgi:N-acyl-D-aspartate/D-glutamate deacylase